MGLINLPDLVIVSRERCASYLGINSLVPKSTSFSRVAEYHDSCSVIITSRKLVGRATHTLKVSSRREILRVISAASHLNHEGCQYLLASAAQHRVDLHLIGYKDR